MTFNAATPYPFSPGRPRPPGTPDGILVDNLYIENGYFFAVKARDAAGNLSPMVATNTAVTPRFNRVATNGTTGLSTEGAAVTFDGVGDANGDGVSDVLMGSF